MAAVYDLIDALENPKWEPKIYVPSFEWHNDVDGKPIINYGWPYLDTSDINIVSLLSMNELIVHEAAYHWDYPRDVVFRFCNFHGVASADALVNSIRSKAAAHGTSLVIQRNCSGRGRRLHEITLACQRYKVYSSKMSRIFDSGQAVGTIIAKEHRPASHMRSSIINSRIQCDATWNDCQRRTTSTLPLFEDNRCHFKLVIFCSSDDNWYLKRATHPCFCTHSNHLFTPIVKQNIKTIPDEVLGFIEAGASVDCEANSLKSLCTKLHDVNLSKHQMAYLKKKCLDKAICEAGTRPYGNAAQELIALFESFHDVNYIYVSHKDSNFITFKKRRKKNQFITVNNPAGVTDHYMQSWRDELKINDSEEVLVAFAWAHDSEVNEFQLYHEFVAIDLTFGTNNLERNVALVCGVDGRMKICTFARCFMPSQKRPAYTWLLDTALPFLLGNTIRKTSVICTDNEYNLNEAVVASAKWRCKLRLDTWHLFNKKWMNLMRSTSLEDLEILDTIRDWIVSWLTRIENDIELVLSKELFDLYYDRESRTLCKRTREELIDIVQHIFANSNHAFNHHFLTTTDFGFISDSIVESGNNILKQKVVANMTLSASASTQVIQSRHRQYTYDLEYGDELNRTFLWSNTCTSQYLTTYAEGLICQRKQKARNYLVREHKHKSWYVLNEQYDVPPKRPLVPNFIHVRRVDLQEDTDGNTFLNCTCGRNQKFLLPCYHITAVFDTLGLDIELCNIHHRWWRIFGAYVHSTDDIMCLDKKMEKVSSLFDSFVCKVTDEYKGIPLSPRQVTIIHQVRPHYELDEPILNTMNIIINMTLDYGPVTLPVLKTYIPDVNDVLPVQHNEDIDAICSLHHGHRDYCNEQDGRIVYHLSQEIGQSQQHQNYESFGASKRLLIPALDEYFKKAARVLTTSTAFQKFTDVMDNCLEEILLENKSSKDGGTSANGDFNDKRRSFINAGYYTKANCPRFLAGYERNNKKLLKRLPPRKRKLNVEDTVMKEVIGIDEDDDESNASHNGEHSDVDVDDTVQDGSPRKRNADNTMINEVIAIDENDDEYKGSKGLLLKRDHLQNRLHSIQTISVKEVIGIDEGDDEYNGSKERLLKRDRLQNRLHSIQTISVKEVIGIDGGDDECTASKELVSKKDNIQKHLHSIQTVSVMKRDFEKCSTLYHHVQITNRLDVSDITQVSESLFTSVANEDDIQMDFIYKNVRLIIEYRSFFRLREDTWLNDKLINAFNALVMNRDDYLSSKDPRRTKSHIFSSYFWTKLMKGNVMTNTYDYSQVKTWGRKTPNRNIFMCEKLFFPINERNLHWSLVVVFVKERKIVYYDSLGSSSSEYVINIRKYLSDEWSMMFGKSNIPQWTLGTCQKCVPKQTNSSDCGIYLCLFIYFICSDMDLTLLYDHQMLFIKCEKNLKDEDKKNLLSWDLRNRFALSLLHTDINKLSFNMNK